MSNDQGNQDDQGNQNDRGNQNDHNKPDGFVCATEICDDIKITVPVEVLTRTDVGRVELKCGEVHIIRKNEKPPNVHKFEVIQKISAKIPINFITEVEVDIECVDFDASECK